MTGQVESEPKTKLDASDVTALKNDLKGRILVNGQGHVLKKVTDPPRGQREVQFYQKITSSDDPECLKWRQLAPKYHGIELIAGVSGELTEHLVLGIILIFCILRKNFYF